MARILSISGEQRTELNRGWQVAIAPADAIPPNGAESLDWIDAPVPGTVAQAIENAGKSTPETLASLQAGTYWYRHVLDVAGPCVLRFSGLATLCDIYLDERRVASSKSMFDPVTISIDIAAKTTLYLHFKPLTGEALAASPRRQRWRAHLVASPHMRNARASLLGHMPGWCPAIQPVGPYRRVEHIIAGPVTADRARVRSWVDGTDGRIEISIDIKGIIDAPIAACGGISTPLSLGSDGLWRGVLTIPEVRLWWPHTHGEPHLYPLAISADKHRIDLGSVGFRTISLDKGADGNGFGLICNGVPIFCRGANWTNADIRRLPGQASDYATLLRRACDAGMNMLRVPGIMTREAPEFFETADKLGIFIWNDEPFANFDYDFDHLSKEFELDRSVSQFLTAIETSPSLAVVCGGSEMAQQGAMLSLPESIWTSKWCTQMLPELVSAVRPDVITVPNSPWGGPLPFQNDHGVTHYYGVGAYQRPLEDARRAGVRFASECLAFANLPQPERLAANAGDARPGTEAWRARVVRDLKADWDFEDTRDFYLGLLHGVDPVRMKAENPERYLALSYAVPGEVMETTFAEWRRVGSVTCGGLVWFLADLGPGFGWGVIDACGVPKPAYFALKRAFRPVTAALTDEGLNGLACHIINESPHPRKLMLTLAAYGADGAIVIDGTRPVDLGPHAAAQLNSTDLFGVFFDTTYAYRFGSPAHEMNVARLTDAETGAFISEAFHFPLGRGADQSETGLQAVLERGEADDWFLTLTTQRPTQSVHIAAAGFEPEDDWFYLAPGQGRRVRLNGQGRPAGVVTATNATERVAFG